MPVSPQHRSTADLTGTHLQPTGGSRLGERLLLLAQDPSLIEALGAVVPADALTVVTDEATLANHLVGGHVGVVFIDAGLATIGSSAQLAARLHTQFPEVVLVAAGDGAVQSELAALVADGTVYRFVHKPVSAQRVKLFVDAAWRKREGTSASGVYPALTMPPQPAPAPASPPPRIPQQAWPAALAGAVLVVAAIAWLLLRSHAPAPTAAVPVAPHRPAPAAQPAAMPPAASAASAAASSTATAATPQDFDRLATAAEQALLSGDLPEATRLTEAARALDPNHVRVRFLSTQIAREQARVAARRHASEFPTAGPAPTASRGVATTATAPPPAAPAVPTASASAPGAATPAGSAPAAPPSSTPPASEAHDRNSVAAVTLNRVYSVDPEFPYAARERDITGFVDLEFTVQADGKVTDVTVLKAQPVGVFERSAIAAVKQWRYAPLSRNGAPTTERARLRLNFAYK